ncbi:Secreted beta-glucosidase sun1 [Penicillium argentinense]|uniref:Secreted beta-glucosidase sun1 n=1 Tax=Penicillium argentinense TaxID=1131581 RepID=A0A9W9FG35_9EURO|nr:Secreted beta-glucosidase sun1 [Penicillium argentinense]KAJ5099337.1 Secreted beta-glucosidase sun1 [Penicillium argentinense]
MKFTNSVAVTLATAGTLVAAHGHGHAHFHKRAVETETDTVPVAGPTVYDFVVLDPKQTGSPEAISKDEACEGLADHKYEWLGSAVANACPTSTATPTPTPSSTSTPTSTVTPQVLLETSAAITPSTPSPSSTSTVEPTTSASSSSSTYSAPASSSSSSSSGATGLTAEFPDGELDCGTFPSEYGAVPLDYLGLGGWSGIQYVTIVDEVVSAIVTAVTGDSCTSGSMCSYACPPGYQKAHWPSTQGSTGQSVGGLECKDGKLYRTNKDHTTLCIEGTGGVHVRNEMSADVAICRTDYPGTESETIPPGCLPRRHPPPDLPQRCHLLPLGGQVYLRSWGDGSEPVGNWAPMNFGVGYSSGATWLSMFKNEPTTDADLDFKVKLVGDDLSDNCRYDGQGNFYNNAGKITSGNGCTAASSSGNAYFVFYE